ncbi:replication protein P [Aliikangiella coralliicola]|uniref:Replication protein P n=1 Tax=Aliikangiella coralliicola TaxID=2592383 RepID=A0A545U043_9GAMM|nr:replication protein P [Aliikangiella coralliicola]TQV82835.1 hypothetical protein FLL46_24000 [Aliikangiella coralliicola]
MELTTAISTGDQSKHVVNQLMKELKAICVAWRVNFEKQEEYNRMRGTWLKALTENNIDSIEKLELGLKIARREAKPLWPSPGEFIKWCEKGVIESLNIPDEYDINRTLIRFNAGQIPRLDKYCYWVWRNIDAKRFLESRVEQSERHLAKVYRKMIRAALSGDEFIEHPTAIPKEVVKVNRKKSSMKIKKIIDGL